MKSKTRILAPTSPTILSSRSLRETSFDEVKDVGLEEVGPVHGDGGLHPLVKTSLILVDGEGGPHLAVETSLIRSTMSASKRLARLKPTVVFTQLWRISGEKNWKRERKQR